VSKGGDAPRMKHFIARMNLAKEVMEWNGIVVKHILAPKMKMDGYSKGCDPRDQKQFAKETSLKK
jgi:hypothetical protein